MVRTTRMSHGRISIFVVLFQKLFTYMQKHNDCLYQAKYCMAFFPWTTCTSLSELQSIYHFYFERGHRVGFLIQLCQHSSDTTDLFLPRNSKSFSDISMTELIGKGPIVEMEMT